LIQAVQWARELNLSVLIDVHGHPGSQNGQDNSGLVGPVLFPSNTSNIDRSLNVLRNLTTEFSQHIYGGIVTGEWHTYTIFASLTLAGIELMNEPRLSSDFSMTQLKSFYSSGSAVVLNASTSWNTTIHDAFWGPSYWAKYSPTNSKPSPAFTLDTHQYYAFAPYNNLPHNDILEHICNVSQILKEHVSSSGIPPTLVGEWSLESGQAPNTSSSSQSNGNDQAKRTWLRLFFEAQLAAYEPNGPGQANIGWTFWSWKQEYEIDTWSYSLGLRDGWIPSDISNMSQRVFPVLDIGCVDAGFKYTAPKHPGRSGSAMTVKTMQWTLWLGMLVSCLYIML
jgi:glucan 1,3-beta-glucosidase